MTDELPFISIIVPCRNEEKFIEKCLKSIASQDYPKENFEILVVDGSSEDKTRDIVRKSMEKYPFVRLLENPKKFTPIGLNIGIKEAKGEIIVRMDAHAGYEKDYISKCIKYLNQYNVDNVGGFMVTLPRNATILGKAIAIVLSHRFGVGNTVFRTGSKEPVLVDTVFGGCYRKEIFEKIGYFDEKLLRGQDMELNMRIKKNGGKILLVPEIKSFYYARSDIKSFWQHSFADGTALISPLKYRLVIFSWRHLCPLMFVSSLIIFLLLSIFSLNFFWAFLGLIGFYFLLAIYFSAKISLSERNFRYLFVIPFAFALFHFGYGLGSVNGFKRILWSR